MAKKKMYSFAEKKHSQKGIISTVLGGTSLFLFLLLSYIAFCYHGQGAEFLGSIGFFALVMSFVGLIYGFMSLVEKDAITLFPKLGALMNGVVFIIWIGIFLLGFGK